MTGKKYYEKGRALKSNEEPYYRYALEGSGKNSA
jgi:hypothetical protein